MRGHNLIGFLGDNRSQKPWPSARHDHSRVLDNSGNVIKNLYAVGEMAGFGGGGSSGNRSLEGTFLSGCILSGRIAARSIGGVAVP